MKPLTVFRNSFIKVHSFCPYQAGESDNMKIGKNDGSTDESAWKQVYENVLNCHFLYIKLMYMFLISANFFNLKTCLPAACSLLCNDREGK